MSKSDRRTAAAPAVSVTPDTPQLKIAHRSRAEVRHLWLPSIFAAVCVIFYLAGGAGQRDYTVPITFYGDSLFPQMLAKTVLDHGWWWNNPSLSAPGTYPALAYPSNSNVDSLVIWVLSRFISHPGLLINLSWMTMLALAGCTSAWCLRVLGASRAVAWCMGLLYAFTPFALYRQIDHLSLVVYLVPLPATAALLLAAGRIPESRRVRLVLAGGCLLIGFNYVYFAFFGAAFLTFAAGIGYFTHRRREIPAAAGVCVALIVGATALNLMPSLQVWAREGRPVSIDKKMPAESENYGLKIRQLISPVREHSLWPFREWAEKETKAAYPLETENVSSRLGLVGSLGFLGLLAAVFVAGRYRGDQAELLLAGGKLTVAGLLLATIGGFGSLFALLISPDIRAWNRLSVFLAFFALAAVALALDKLARRGRPIAGAVATAAVCAFGLYDQLHAFAPLNAIRGSIRAEYGAVESAVRKLEERLPRGSMVLQLPLRPFPSDTGTGGMGPYVHFRAYLVSRHLRWSYPPLMNEHMLYQSRLMRLTIPELMAAARRDGFAGVLIDRSGYADGAASVEGEIAQVLAPDGVVWRNERYIALDIRKAEAEALSKAAAQMPRCDAPATFHIDRIAAASASEPVVVAGWAIDATSGKPARRVEIVLAGQRFIANYGLPRPDVAASYGNPAYASAGFDLVVPSGTFPIGTHPFTVRVVTSDGGCYQQGPPLTITVHR